MKFYNKTRSGYEELISYYPRYYRDVLEMVAILQAFGRLTDEIEGHIEQTHLNNFVLTADETTIKQFESIFHITNGASMTLEQRRRVIIGWISGGSHIGEPEIRSLIKNYTDNAVTVDFAKGVVSVVISGEIFGEDNLLATLVQRLPAHLRLDMSIRVERSFRFPLNINSGGAVGAAFTSAPIREDRTSRSRIYVGYGGRAAAEFNTSPVGENRTSRKSVLVGQGGFLDHGVTTNPTEVKKTARGHENGVGGAYYHTHTKTKLIG